MLFKRFQFKLILIFFITFIVCNFQLKIAAGAPCCAKNSAVPVLITGDDKFQLGIASSITGVVAQVFNDGIPIFGSTDTSEYIGSFKLEGALMLSDRLQIGAGIPITHYSYTYFSETNSSIGLGDVRLNLGYEVMPSWSYSTWKPQGFLFSALTLPTGRSRYESQSLTSTDVTGNGFFTFTLGALLLKNWTIWDIFLVPEVHYSFSRSFHLSRGDFLVQPGFGGSIGLGIGYSPGAGNFRFGFRLQPRLDQAPMVPSSDENRSNSGLITYCDTGIDLGYMIGSQDTIMVSYTDQTLFGEVRNSALSRSIGINFQHRWER